MIKALIYLGLIGTMTLGFFKNPLADWASIAMIIIVGAYNSQAD